MARRRLWTESRIIGELLTQELMEAGVLVHAMAPQTGVVWYNPNTIEIWLDDERLLTDPETQIKIRDVFTPRPLTEPDGDIIQSLPLFTEFPKTPRPKFQWTQKHSTFAVILGTLLLIYIVWRALGSY